MLGFPLGWFSSLMSCCQSKSLFQLLDHLIAYRLPFRQQGGFNIISSKHALCVSLRSEEIYNSLRTPLWPLGIPNEAEGDLAASSAANLCCCPTPNSIRTSCQAATCAITMISCRILPRSLRCSCQVPMSSSPFSWPPTYIGRGSVK